MRRPNINPLSFEEPSDLSSFVCDVDFRNKKNSHTVIYPIGVNVISFIKSIIKRLNIYYVRKYKENKVN